MSRMQLRSGTAAAAAEGEASEAVPAGGQAAEGPLEEGGQGEGADGRRSTSPLGGGTDVPRFQGEADGILGAIAHGVLTGP